MSQLNYIVDTSVSVAASALAANTLIRRYGFLVGFCRRKILNSLSIVSLAVDHTLILFLIDRLLPVAVCQQDVHDPESSMGIHCVRVFHPPLRAYPLRYYEVMFAFLLLPKTGNYTLDRRLNSTTCLFVQVWVCPPRQVKVFA